MEHFAKATCQSLRADVTTDKQTAEIEHPDPVLNRYA